MFLWKISPISQYYYENRQSLDCVDDDDLEFNVLFNTIKS